MFWKETLLSFVCCNFESRYALSINNSLYQYVLLLQDTPNNTLKKPILCYHKSVMLSVTFIVISQATLK